MAASDPVIYRTPVVDPKTGLMTREWVRFLEQLASGVDLVNNALSSNIQQLFNDNPQGTNYGDIVTHNDAEYPKLATDNHFTGRNGFETAPRQQVSVGDLLDIYSGTLNAPSVASLRATASGSNVTLNAPGSGSVYLNLDSGSGGTKFGNGDASSVVASVDNTGKFTGAGLSITNPSNIAFGSNWQNWPTPTITGSGSMTVSSVSGLVAQYLRIGPIVHFYITVTFVLGGTASNEVLVTLPVSAVGSDFVATPAYGTPSGGSQQVFVGFVHLDTSQLSIRLNLNANWPLGTVTGMRVSGSYRCT